MRFLNTNLSHANLLVTQQSATQTQRSSLYLKSEAEDETIVHVALQLSIRPFDELIAGRCRSTAWRYSPFVYFSVPDALLLWPSPSPYKQYLLNNLVSHNYKPPYPDLLSGSM